MRDGAKKEFARELRSRMTDAELRLWAVLRRKQLAGCRFRRQHPIGPYVADFACVERKLIVEIDGGQHDAEGADSVRTASLERHGYSVMRFWNNEVMCRTPDVVDRILRALNCSTHPHPDLPPQAGEGEQRSGPQGCRP